MKYLVEIISISRAADAVNGIAVLWPFRT